MQAHLENKKTPLTKMAQIEGNNSITSINIDNWVENISQEKKGDLEVIDLKLKTPPGCPSLVG